MIDLSTDKNKMQENDKKADAPVKELDDVRMGLPGIEPGFSRS
jgi:hypothetical protein